MTKHLRQRLAVLLTVFSFCAVQAQNISSKLSLEQAIRIAQEQSLRKKSIDALFQSSRWEFKSANASRFTNISLAGNIPGLNRRINAITQPDGTVLFIPQSTAISTISLQLSQPIMPIGGNIWVSSELSRLDLFSSNTAYWSSSPLVIGLNIPLAAFNRRKWEWKQAKIRYTQSTSVYAENLEDLSITVTQGYFDYYIAGLVYRNARQNEIINDSIFRISQGRYNVGKIAENELLQVELSLMNARNDVSQSKLQKEIAEERLKIYLGLNRNESVELDTLPPLKILDIDVNRAILEAKENSSIVRQNQLNLNNALMNMREASRNRFINGSLSATFGLNQTSTDFSQVYTDPLNSQTATIDFNIPLYNFGKAKADYKMNKYIYESTVAETELAMLNLEVTIKQQVMELKRLESAVLVSEKANDIAARRYEVSKNRFLIGKIDITNLTIAQNEKDQALLSYIRSLRDYWIAYYSLRKSTLYDFEKNEKLIVLPAKK